MPISEERDGATSQASRGSHASLVSSRSRVPLSARSIASAISMHVNSYSYLSDRVYDFVESKAVWLQRTKSQTDGGDHDAAVLNRLPPDFEPFFAIDTTRRTETETVNGESGDAQGGGRGWRECFTAVGFRVLFAVFSNRMWDRAYLLLLLLWSVQCPAQMDGVVKAKRQQLATLMMVVSVMAVIPAALAVILKAFFPLKLRAHLQSSKGLEGVFFVLATKSIPVPRALDCRWRHGPRVYAARLDGNDDLVHHDTAGVSAKQLRGEDKERAPLGGGHGSNTPSVRPGSTRAEGSHRGVLAMHGRVGEGGNNNRRERGADQGNIAGNTIQLDLPPRHWMCTVCKKVNRLPEIWDGRSTKMIQVVMKRKTVDKEAMYADFITKPQVPVCDKCQTPFNYSWRNGGAEEDEIRQHPPLDLKHSRPRTVQSAAFTHGHVVNTITDAACSTSDEAKTVPTAGLSMGLNAIAGSISGLLALVQSIGKSGGPEKRRGGLGIEGGKTSDANRGPELYYGRDFRRQLSTYFKPQLERPKLVDQGGRYKVGDRVASFAGKQAWYPGQVTASRENNTYDVRYDNGDIAQHVFLHTIRFEPKKTDSALLCWYYGLVLAAAVVWPLTGFGFFSATGSTRGALVAMPALVLGAAGAVAVAAQFWEIYQQNKSVGLRIAIRYATVIALPSLSLGLVGAVAVAKALNPLYTGSWVEMLFLPAILFSLTGCVYAYAVSPAYGGVWAVASLPWLLFLLLTSLRLDGEVGNARPSFGRMSWLGVYFPLWVLLLMVIMAHHVLPYVWEIKLYAEPGDSPDSSCDWHVLSRQAERLRNALGTAVNRIKERGGGSRVAGVAIDKTDETESGVKRREDDGESSLD